MVQLKIKGHRLVNNLYPFRIGIFQTSTHKLPIPKNRFDDAEYRLYRTFALGVSRLA